MNPNKISILIQGKFHLNSLRTINTYIDQFEIVLSTYDYPLYLEDYNSLKIVKNQIQIPDSTYNRQNIYFQCNTTLNGLLKCTKEFVLKLRTDEFYSNLNLINFKDLIYSNNVFLREWDYSPFHFSDHFIFCRKEILINSFFDLKKYLSKSTPFFELKNDITPSESIIHSFIFFNKVGYCLSKQEFDASDLEKLKHHYEIINVKLLEPYIIKSSVVGFDILDLEKFIKNDVKLNLRLIENVNRMITKNNFISKFNKFANRLNYKIKRLLHEKNH